MQGCRLGLAQNRHQWRVFVNMTMNLRVPQEVEELLSILATTAFSKGNLFDGDKIYIKI
jgi:hypothetical protein